MRHISRFSFQHFRWLNILLFSTYCNFSNDRTARDPQTTKGGFLV
jgi:hypothetical protein